MKAVAVLSLLFSLLTGLQFFSGVYLFYVRYYSVDLEVLTQKSIYGLSEVAFPHFLSITLTGFILLHLFYFFKIKIKHFVLGFFLIFFGWMDILSNLFMVYLSEKFIYLKFLSFFMFEGLLFYTTVLLFVGFLKKLRTT